MKFQHQEDHHQQQQQNIIKRTNKLELNQINGIRPMQLQVHKNSHIIHKYKYSSASASSSATTAACSSSSTTKSNKHNNRNGPVIIYTHSPKVIHTQPHDFMALVQKLTGSNISNVKQSNEVVNESVCDEVAGDKVIKDLNVDYGLSDKFVGNDNRKFLYEIPLFTPTGLDLGHDQQQFRFEGESIFSPTTLEFLKPLPEC